MLLNPHALLFDMDGVLIDSLNSWWQSLNTALETFHLPTISREEFTKKYWGHDLRDNLKTMGLSQKIGTFCNTSYSQHLHAIRMYPETIPTLETLITYKKGIITNTPQACTRQILKQFAIQHYFQAIVTSDEVQHAKPDPEIIFRACQLLQIKPENAVVIGDTSSDVQAGRAAGCTVIGINVDADIRIATLKELPSVLETKQTKKPF